ncbi:MAG: branched-chain amino acid ABC transporter permease [Hyphomicrobiaceae bacterium]|nr:branched-chain amino acid ABC transporter permease [Hyphomicrobiaceae bacterium]
MEILIVQILNSIFQAASLFLLAAGLSLIYGVMRIVNLAHGNFYAFGAYVSAWTVGAAVALAASRGINLGVAGQLVLLPLGALAVAALGAIVEPTLLRPLYRRPEEYILLITFGLLMVLEDVIRLVFGGTPLTAGSIMDAMGSIPIGGLLYPAYNLVVVGVGVVAAIGLWLFVYRTRFGVILRATSQDRRMAAALGLNVGRVYIQAFAIGCFLAGLGGAVVVPAQAAVLGMGVDALVQAFVVIVIGGLGSLEGALVGALIVSAVRTAGVQFFAEIELAVLYLIAVAVLLWRPTGLFGRA